MERYFLLCVRLMCLCNKIRDLEKQQVQDVYLEIATLKINYFNFDVSCFDLLFNSALNQLCIFKCFVGSRFGGLAEQSFIWKQMKHHEKCLMKISAGRLECCLVLQIRCLLKTPCNDLLLERRRRMDSFRTTSMKNVDEMLAHECLVRSQCYKNKIINFVFWKQLGLAIGKM